MQKESVEPDPKSSPDLAPEWGECTPPQSEGGSVNEEKDRWAVLTQEADSKGLALFNLKSSFTSLSSWQLI